MKPVVHMPPVGPRNPAERLQWFRFDYSGHGELHSPRTQRGGPEPQPNQPGPEVVRSSKGENRRRAGRHGTYHAGGMNSFQIANKRRKGGA